VVSTYEPDGRARFGSLPAGGWPGTATPGAPRRDDSHRLDCYLCHCRRSIPRGARPLERDQFSDTGPQQVSGQAVSV